MPDLVSNGSWYKTQVTLTCTRCKSVYRYRCNELNLVNTPTDIEYPYRVKTECEECGKVDVYKARTFPTTDLVFSP